MSYKANFRPVEMLRRGHWVRRKADLTPGKGLILGCDRHCKRRPTYRLARALLFRLDPETAHGLTLDALAAAHAVGATRALRPDLPDDPVQVMGLTFPNPVGLAAGLDKNGAFVETARSARLRLASRPAP